MYTQRSRLKLLNFGKGLFRNSLVSPNASSVLLVQNIYSFHQEQRPTPIYEHHRTFWSFNFLAAPLGRIRLSNYIKERFRKCSLTTLTSNPFLFYLPLTPPNQTTRTISQLFQWNLYPNNNRMNDTHTQKRTSYTNTKINSTTFQRRNRKTTGSILLTNHSRRINFGSNQRRFLFRKSS